jgi:hypothetical protein
LKEARGDKMPETRKLIQDLLPKGGPFISQGELYRDSQARGYLGTQESLIEFADEMVSQGELVSRRRGMAQNFWYRRVTSSEKGSL